VGLFFASERVRNSSVACYLGGSMNRNMPAVVIRFGEAHWEDEEQIRRVSGS
jgi:hypothetical protein